MPRVAVVAAIQSPQLEPECVPFVWVPVRTNWPPIWPPISLKLIACAMLLDVSCVESFATTVTGSLARIHGPVDPTRWMASVLLSEAHATHCRPPPRLFAAVLQ